jgi:ribosomal-protein-alanine N-acetyltransferase
MGFPIHLDTFPTLETERLLLRQLASADARDAFLFLSDEENIRYYDAAPMTRLEQVEKSIERHRRRFAEQEALRWGITLKGENRVIGNGGYTLDAENHLATLSYILSKHYWNRGIMTEALTAMIQFGFDHLLVHRVEAQVAYPNLASARLLEKLGFQEEGRLRDRQYVNHQFVDERIFALINPNHAHGYIFP